MIDFWDIAFFVSGGVVGFLWASLYYLKKLILLQDDLNQCRKIVGERTAEIAHIHEAKRR